MHFLTCIKCQHRNDLKNENITFCGNCGERLPYNYQDYKHHHPDATFSAYLESLYPAAPAEVPADVFPEEDTSRRNNIKLLVWVLVIAVAAGAFKFLYLDKPAFLSKITGNEWRNFSDGPDGNIDIETPVEMKREATGSGSGEKGIDVSNDFKGGNDTFLVSYSHNHYRRNYGFDPALAANGIVFAFKDNQLVLDFTFKEEKGIINGMGAARVHGTYTYNHTRYRYDMMLAGKKQDGWIIGVTYDESIPGATEKGDRIINSMKFIKTGEE